MKKDTKDTISWVIAGILLSIAVLFVMQGIKRMDFLKTSIAVGNYFKEKAIGDTVVIDDNEIAFGYEEFIKS